MDKQALKTLLGDFLGKPTPLAESVSSISDMNELMRLWNEHKKDSGVQKAVEARMAEVIGALPIDNADKIPEWFATIVKDEMLLPSKSLRDLLRRKAKKIYSRLAKGQNTLQV
ncbi:MAG: hypothetical protein PHZ04_01150 [Patescibacteria group bacterium]|nr:hypothetical protein [Patescibacteria group bacterium]MDD5554413.1 hypothetical protein [Patescibacteria group bacterium]